MTAPTLSSVDRVVNHLNTVPAAAEPSATAAITIAASTAVLPEGLRWAYGGREKPVTVSQPMMPSGTDATGSAIKEVVPTTTAAAIRTPVAGSLPFRPAATVPTANSAAKATGSAYGAGNPPRP